MVSNTLIELESLLVIYLPFNRVLQTIKHLFQEIKSNIEELVEDPKLNGDAFIFTILSHGDKNGIRTKDGSLNLEEDIIKKFSMCGVLDRKPKVFIIQACRGRK